MTYRFPLNTVLITNANRDKVGTALTTAYAVEMQTMKVQQYHSGTGNWYLPARREICIYRGQILTKIGC
jgi:hypothetical protein